MRDARVAVAPPAEAAPGAPAEVTVKRRAGYRVKDSVTHDRRRLAVLNREGLREEAEAAAAAGEAPRVERPATRDECLAGGPHAERPCPWVGCKHHLYLDVKRNGSIVMNFPDVDVADMPVSCALDVADRGLAAWGADAEGPAEPASEPGRAAAVRKEDGETLEAVGRALGFTRERARQIVTKAVGRLRRSLNLSPAEAAAMVELLDELDERPERAAPGATACPVVTRTAPGASGSGERGRRPDDPEAAAIYDRLMAATDPRRIRPAGRKKTGRGA